MSAQKISSREKGKAKAKKKNSSSGGEIATPLAHDKARIAEIEGYFSRLRSEKYFIPKSPTTPSVLSVCSYKGLDSL
ncbi:MAG: hypothetical protein U0Y68_20905 [Blastocatellia bacterium]